MVCMHIFLTVDVFEYDFGMHLGMISIDLVCTAAKYGICGELLFFRFFYSHVFLFSFLPFGFAESFMFKFLFFSGTLFNCSPLS